MRCVVYVVYRVTLDGDGAQRMYFGIENTKFYVVAGCSAIIMASYASENGEQAMNLSELQIEKN